MLTNFIIIFGDFLEEINEIISYLIPDSTSIEFRDVVIVGKPGSGKTNLAFYLASRIEKEVKDVNVIFMQDGSKMRLDTWIEDIINC